MEGLTLLHGIDSLRESIIMNINEVKYRSTEAEWLGQYDSDVQYSNAQTQTAFLSGDHSTVVAMCLYVAGKSKHVPLPLLQPRVLPRKPKNEAENEERIIRKVRDPKQS
jgi:hypothetical protein